MTKADSNPYSAHIIELLGLKPTDLPKIDELFLGSKAIVMLLHDEHQEMAAELKRLKNYRRMNGAYFLFSIPHEHEQVLAEIRQRTRCRSQFDAEQGAPC